MAKPKMEFCRSCLTNHTILQSCVQGEGNRKLRWESWWKHQQMTIFEVLEGGGTYEANLERLRIEKITGRKMTLDEVGRLVSIPASMIAPFRVDVGDEEATSGS